MVKTGCIGYNLLSIFFFELHFSKRRIGHHCSNKLSLYSTATQNPSCWGLALGNTTKVRLLHCQNQHLLALGVGVGSNANFSIFRYQHVGIANADFRVGGLTQHEQVGARIGHVFSFYVVCVNFVPVGYPTRNPLFGRIWALNLRHWFGHPTHSFCVTHTNMQVSKSLCGPNANPNQPNVGSNANWWNMVAFTNICVGFPLGMSISCSFSTFFP